VIRQSKFIPLWLRMTGLVIAASIFIWIPFEDLDIQWVLLLSAAVCSWFATRVLLTKTTRKWSNVIFHSLVGCLAGGAVALLAFLLIILKNGLHAHETPDFTVAQIQALFYLVPYLTISGLLIGFGFGLLRTVR
jgi:hypothetical protein